MPSCFVSARSPCTASKDTRVHSSAVPCGFCLASRQRRQHRPWAHVSSRRSSPASIDVLCRCANNIRGAPAEMSRGHCAMDPTPCFAPGIFEQVWTCFTSPFSSVHLTSFFGVGTFVFFSSGLLRHPPDQQPRRTTISAGGEKDRLNVAAT